MNSPLESDLQRPPRSIPSCGSVAGEPFDQGTFSMFCGRVAGLERAIWEWSRGQPVARFIHSSLGHETAAYVVTRLVGTEQARYALYYRSHAWLLGLGLSPEQVAHGIIGDGLGGITDRSGPMHLLLHESIIDCNSIVGAQIPIAVGAALANRSLGFLTVCVMGDGASTTGVFFEALNIAALFRLPILFVVEDNALAMESCYSRFSGAKLEEKFRLFSIPFYGAQANSPEHVFRQASDAVRLAWQGPAALCVSGVRSGPHAIAFLDYWSDDLGRLENEQSREAMINAYRGCMIAIKNSPTRSGS